MQRQVNVRFEATVSFLELFPYIGISGNFRESFWRIPYDRCITSDSGNGLYRHQNTNSSCCFSPSITFLAWGSNLMAITALILSLQESKPSRDGTLSALKDLLSLHYDSFCPPKYTVVRY